MRNHTRKNILNILIIIFLSPFILIFIGDHFYSIGPLYTFGIVDLKDFFMFWIGVFGVFGVVYNISQNQTRISQQDKLIDITNKDRRDSRFAKGVELLSSSNESTRIGGVYDLYFLVKEFPNDYTYSVFNVLSSHIRSLTSTVAYQNEHKFQPSTDIQLILNLLTSDLDKTFKGHTLDLHDSYLVGVNLQNKILNYANLEYTRFYRSDLTGTQFVHSLLTKTSFEKADLTLANLSNATIENSTFYHATLKMTNLSNSYLHGSIFHGARIEKSILKNAKVDIGTLQKQAEYIRDTDLSEVQIIEQ